MKKEIYELGVKQMLDNTFSNLDCKIDDKK